MKLSIGNGEILGGKSENPIAFDCYQIFVMFSILPNVPNYCTYVNPPFHISYAPGIFMLVRLGKQQLPAVVSIVNCNG